MQNADQQPQLHTCDGSPDCKECAGAPDLDTPMILRTESLEQAIGELVTSGAFDIHPAESPYGLERVLIEGARELREEVAALRTENKRLRADLDRMFRNSERWRKQAQKNAADYRRASGIIDDGLGAQEQYGVDVGRQTL